MSSDEFDAWLAAYVRSDSAEMSSASPGPKRVEPDWIDVWLTQQLQDDPADLSPDAPDMVKTAIQFLEPFEPSFDLLKDLTGVSRISSLRADDGSTDHDPYVRPWRLRHAMQGLHHGGFTLPWFRAARLVHAARLQGLKVRILPSGVGSPAVPDEIELGSLGLPEPLVAELHERGVRNVGQLRQMPKRALQELGFLSTFLAGVRGLRGEATGRSLGAVADRREFTLNPWELLPAEVEASLQLAAQAEVQRRLDARLPPEVVSGGSQTTLEWVQEVRAIEHRRIRAELAVRADEVLELLHCF
jgi:hypothetical protein